MRRDYHLLCAVPQGRHIDGSQRRAIPALVTGKLARRDLLKEWNLRTDGPLPAEPYEFRLSDGHLPEHQPRTRNIADAQAFLAANPYSPAYLVYPSLDPAPEAYCPECNGLCNGGCVQVMR